MEKLIIKLYISVHNLRSEVLRVRYFRVQVIPIVDPFACRILARVEIFPRPPLLTIYIAQSLGNKRIESAHFQMPMHARMRP